MQTLAHLITVGLVNDTLFPPENIGITNPLNVLSLEIRASPLRLLGRLACQILDDTNPAQVG